MTLLDKICRYTIPLGIVIGMLSCEDPSEVGLSLNTDGTQIGVYYEELTLPASNYFIDSLRTEGTTRLLVGKFADPVFGTTTSEAVTQIGLDNFTFAVRDNSLDDSENHVEDYFLDSVVLQLKLNYYHSDNVGQPQTFKVLQISDTLFSGVGYFAHFAPKVDDQSTVYGESVEVIDLEQDSIVRISLPLFGEQSLDYMRTQTVGAINSDSLINIVKGIALIPGENNSAIVGFNPNSADTKLGVYYHIKNVPKDSVVADSLSITYNLSASSSISTVRYNSIRTDRSTSVMNVVPESFNSFDLNDGKVYLQSGTGIYTQLDLTPFKDFLEQTEKLIINRTDIELTLSPEVSGNSYRENIDDARLFFLTEGANISNTTGTVVLTNDSYLSSTVNSAASAKLDDEDMTYKVETTLFSQQFNNDVLDTDKLLLVPSDITSMNQSVFDKSGVKLKIYYTIPK